MTVKPVGSDNVAADYLLFANVRGVKGSLKVPQVRTTGSCCLLEASVEQQCPIWQITTLCTAWNCHRAFRLKNNFNLGAANLSKNNQWDTSCKWRSVAREQENGYISWTQHYKLFSSWTDLIYCKLCEWAQFMNPLNPKLMLAVYVQQYIMLLRTHCDWVLVNKNGSLLTTLHLSLQILCSLLYLVVSKELISLSCENSFTVTLLWQQMLRHKRLRQT